MTNIVVGSGIAGMTLALMLAKQGEQVLVIEAKHQIAPLMNGFTREGIFFDTGFHYAGGLQEKGALYKWLNALDLWQHMPDKAFYPVVEEFCFTSKKHYFASHDESLIPALKEQFHTNNDKEKDHFIQQFKDFRALMQKCLEASPFLNPSQENMSLHNDYDEQSLSEVLKKFDFPPYLTHMLTARCQLLGVEAEKCSFKNYAVLSEPYFQSSASLKGGGKAIREAFIKELDKFNVEIQCNTLLKKVCVEEKKVKAIQVQRKGITEEIPCTRCFFTGHPKDIAHIVPAHTFRPAFLHRIEDLKESPLAFMLFAKTRSNYLENKVLYILDENEEEFFNPLEEQNPIIYVSSGEKHEGYYPLIAIATVRDDIKKSDPNYSAWKEEMTIKLSNYILKRIPELKNIEILDSSTPHTMRHWVHSSTGSLYGIKHSCDELPLLPITKLEGFYMASQNILLPGLLGSMVSALVCLSLIFGDKKILQGFRTWKKDV